MRLLKRILLLLLILLLIFASYTVLSVGTFRSIEATFDGRVLRSIPLKGAEDITISLPDSFALISATDRQGYPATEEAGGIYWMDLRNDRFDPVPLTQNFPLPFAPHGISLFAKDSSYQLMAINHTPTGHSIEVFELKDQTLAHLQTLEHPSMIQPNDVVMLDEKRFYFTNDHAYPKGIGRLMEDYGGLAVSDVIYFDGNDYRKVADGIAYANGINVDTSRNLLYVASPRFFLVKVYHIQEDGSLSFVEDIPCGSGVDNIELDPSGDLWIGAHPQLLQFSAYAKGNREIAPSEIIKIHYEAKGIYTVESLYLEKGETLSASTVAAPFGNRLLVGSVTDDHFLVLERND